MASILHFITFIWITGIFEQKYIVTVMTVIKLQAGQKLDMESQRFYCVSYTFYSINK